jgi:dCMP deaminase
MSSEIQDRPNWNDYFMGICKQVAQRSTCLRRQNGALAVKDKRILSTGYNGQMSNAPHCRTCLREKLSVPSGQRHELCKVIHSEANVVIQCAKYGVSMENSILYTILKPCSMCFKMLVNVGVAEIIYEKEYPDEITDILIKEAAFKLKQTGNYFALYKG